MQTDLFSTASNRLTIDLSALKDNWLRMRQLSGKARTSAVVKANAYGLGVEPVARALASAGARDFFVASMEEGIELRGILADVRIYILAGLWPGHEKAFQQHGLIPVINSVEQLEVVRQAGWLPYALHVDTGMNRLGLSLQEARQVAASDAPSPLVVMSHLACGDEPGHPLNASQLSRFRQAAALFPDAEASLANSAGVFQGDDFHFDLTRPGIAVYGGEAVNDAANPMKPVVKAEARIIQIRSALAGDTASYGASATLARDTRIATVTVGYADGYHRSVSGAGVTVRQAAPSGAFGFLHGTRVPHLGRVTMDLSLFDVSDLPETAVTAGDYIELFGNAIALDDVARAGGTIGYELLTSLGKRYVRHYIGG
ncbi:alanine racemase [Rhizobium sp. CFBP 8762]|uniref:alanine racemase n=1 Tax=Rhizobium sp. CFBP 8762 TaxID=2775279 RepID=UPI00177DBA4D|nr:alanine racemase [Rhizobium sp. CFBP 8762]MBD8553076.1 alanine racemase [Rhizobium sp. CFBP 8762]